MSTDKPKHTPSPWAFQKIGGVMPDGTNYSAISIYQSDVEEEDTPDEDNTIAGIWSLDPVDFANAQLIAAAPDLLEVLKDFCGLIEMNCRGQSKSIENADANQIEWSSLFEAAEQAIQKARGES